MKTSSFEYNKKIADQFMDPAINTIAEILKQRVSAQGTVVNVSNTYVVVVV